MGTPLRRLAADAALDSVLVPIARCRRLSAAWVAVAAALALTCGRTGRRAALRGLLAAGAASASANLVLKPLSRRRRPASTLHTRLVRARRVSKPWSFPSGHTATAAAFATGVAQEMPSAGVPLAASAALVAWSRAWSRSHHASDVVAAAALGAGIGVATRRLWPVAPRDGVPPGPALTRLGTAPSPTGRGLAVVVNADAGPALARNPAERLREALPEAEVVVVAGDQVEEALERAAASAAAVGVAGGDGTANAAAGAAHRRGRPLLVVPAGTLNHLARDLGMTSIDDAVAAVASGHTVAVDVASIDGHPFLNTASLGSYVELVDLRERLQERLGKWPAGAVALVVVLRRSRPVRLAIDGRERRIWMMFVGNCRYHPPGFAPTWRECLDDGDLDIRIVDADEPWSRLRLVASVLIGRLARCRVYEQRCQRRLDVRSLDGPLRLARDGETFDGGTEFSIEKLRGPLAVFVPSP